VPEDPVNGSAFYFEVFEGSWVIYFCNHGYGVYNESDRAYCSDSGSWSVPSPTCTPIGMSHK